jgi:hypothetical protein
MRYQAMVAVVRAAAQSSQLRPKAEGVKELWRGVEWRSWHRTASAHTSLTEVAEWLQICEMLHSGIT